MLAPLAVIADRLPGLRSTRATRATALLPPAVGIALLLGSAIYSLHTNILAAIVRREAGDGRAIVLNAVQREPGRHIIFVDYAPGPRNEFEWVTNGADLPGAPVLWAHMRTTEQSMALLKDFPDRNVWMLTVENEHFDLKSVLLLREKQAAKSAG